MKLTKTLIAASAVAVLGVSALAGCSAGGGSGDGAGSASLTIAKPDGAISTESNNPFVGDSAASKYGYAKVVFETLALVNQTGDRGVTPWLAESLEWNDDYTQLTVVPRADVTWSDGEPFTADDIVFSFETASIPALDTAGLKFEGAEVDGDKVVLSFGDSKYVNQARVLHVPIVPKHIWENFDDPATDPVKGDDLVGTGPYAMANWSTESVTLDARDDYWGGDLAVPELHYVSYGDNTALTTALANGDADWAQAFIPQIEEQFLSADPEHNKFLASPTTGSATLFMNLQQKPFDDPAFRQALAWVIDRDAYVDIAREGASEPVWSVTGLSSILEDEIQPEFQGVDYTVDAEKARDLLETAGYTWKDDALIDPDGTPVSFTLSVPSGWSDWNTAQELIAEDVKDGIGAEVKIDMPDWGGWADPRDNGTFSAIIHWLEDSGTAYGLYTSTMDPRWISPEGKAGFNFGRFDDPEATAALNTYANASSDEERTTAIDTLQTIFSEQVPAIPLGAHPLLGEFNTRNYVGWPSETDTYASADPTQPNIVQILTKLKPAE
ncbi:ABC transporter substrate-binding protein [Microbacterium paraoxydans]|jgi:peptide/nickel transport system substrate-binding protein|uniref:Peptide/nickel transport system substrate-binding protein n=1 Tax=Microbacterium paraoxydans TaxID=199592 RepID=A0A1H1U394_9MICO|nr:MULTISPECIES: ABC transporter substrate-binding protein [Microbacterium]AVL95937.1 ABC transporter substrate-binding protein [Microbacterium sp. str. 'China']MCT2224154.1 ABC transporter substrate-binding protein [Microbacterium paraoxydans]SDS66972.1 peptide/nickel transport system substrate-binding protein [Microbacterium paraoxydans]